MATAMQKPGFLIALIAMLLAALVIAPAADAYTCATDPFVEHTHEEAADTDSHGHELAGQSASDGPHGVCAHGHTHAGPGARIDAPILWSPILPGADRPGIGMSDRWAAFSPDALDRPPRR